MFEAYGHGRGWRIESYGMICATSVAFCGSGPSAKEEYATTSHQRKIGGLEVQEMFFMATTRKTARRTRPVAHGGIEGDSDDSTLLSSPSHINATEKKIDTQYQMEHLYYSGT